MSSTTWRASRTRSAPAASRPRWPTVWVTACSSLALAGCGGGGDSRPAIPAGTAEALAARSDAVAESLAAGDACAADREADALVAAAIEAVNAGAVPAPLQEELLGSAQSLAARVECPPPPPSAPSADQAEDEAEPEGRGKGKGKDKEKDKEEKGDDD